MNLETPSDLSQHNFLGCKRVFQADEFTVWLFWKHGNSFSPVLGYLMARGHHLLTSLAVVWISHQPHQASFYHHLSCDRAVSLIKKMHLQSLFSQRMAYIFKLTSKDHWASLPATYKNASKTILHLNFPTKDPRKYVKTLTHIQKGPAVIFKCTPVTSASKRKICAFASNG